MRMTNDNEQQQSKSKIKIMKPQTNLIKSKIKINIILILLFLGCITISSDVLGQTISKTFGGVSGEYPQCIIKTGDGGYAMCGYTNSYGAGGNDAWVIKTGASGAITWQYTFGGTGNDRAYSIIQDGTDYVVAGYYDNLSGGSYPSDAWIFKLNSTGGIVWQYTYGIYDYNEMLYSIIKDGSGDYVAAGMTNSYASGNYDALVLKVPATGSATPV